MLTSHEHCTCPSFNTDKTDSNTLKLFHLLDLFRRHSRGFFSTSSRRSLAATCATTSTKRILNSVRVVCMSVLNARACTAPVSSEAETDGLTEQLPEI